MAGHHQGAPQLRAGALRTDCWLFFGKETAGLPAALLERFRERCVRIPMLPDVRCLNLSNSVAVLVYEALRQNGFPGLTGVGAMGGVPTP